MRPRAFQMRRDWTKNTLRLGLSLDGTAKSLGLPSSWCEKQKADRLEELGIFTRVSNQHFFINQITLLQGIAKGLLTVRLRGLTGEERTPENLMRAVLGRIADEAIVLEPFNMDHVLTSNRLFPASIYGRGLLPKARALLSVIHLRQFEFDEPSDHLHHLSVFGAKAYPQYSSNPEERTNMGAFIAHAAMAMHPDARDAQEKLLVGVVRELFPQSGRTKGLLLLAAQQRLDAPE